MGVRGTIGANWSLITLTTLDCFLFAAPELDFLAGFAFTTAEFGFLVPFPAVPLICSIGDGREDLAGVGTIVAVFFCNGGGAGLVAVLLPLLLVADDIVVVVVIEDEVTPRS